MTSSLHRSTSHFVWLFNIWEIFPKIKNRRNQPFLPLLLFVNIYCSCNDFRSYEINRRYGLLFCSHSLFVWLLPEYGSVGMTSPSKDTRGRSDSSSIRQLKRHACCTSHETNENNTQRHSKYDFAMWRGQSERGKYSPSLKLPHLIPQST